MSDDPTPGLAELEEELAGEPEPKRRKKEAKLLAEAARPLSPWERYRALVDTLEEALDLVELADRKARFALVIMGALNVAFFFLATRSEIIDFIPLRLRPFMGFYLVVYAAVALFFFLEAIEALRPRRFRPHVPYPGAAGPDHYPEGLRYHEDIVVRDVEAYRRAWREVRFGQLNAELAVQNHIMARINQDKYRSLRRLYAGLRVLTVLAGGLLAVLALSMLFNRPPRVALGLPGAGSGGAAPAALVSPAAVSVPGLREASGVTWDPSSRRLFVVSDRGTLRSIDRSGSVLATHRVKGNIEDVTVHGPSGLLVLLAEKKGELVVWSPPAGEEKARFTLDVAALLGREPADRNQGFEGIAFREEAGRPGGGVFYLVHQRRPARLVAVTFDPTAPPRVIGVNDVLARHSLKPYEDLTAVSWSAPLEHLLVIAEKADRLLAVSTEGRITAALALPGGQQEGLGLDEDGTLWVADERLGLLRIGGALGTIEAALTGAPAGGDTAGS